MIQSLIHPFIHHSHHDSIQHTVHCSNLMSTEWIRHLASLWEWPYFTEIDEERKEADHSTTVSALLLCKHCALPYICLSRLQEDSKNTSREGWKAIIGDLYLSQPHIWAHLRASSLCHGRSEQNCPVSSIILWKTNFARLRVCVHVWPSHNLHSWLTGGRYFYAHWPRGRNIVRCACRVAEMSVTTRIYNNNSEKNHRAHKHKQNHKTACSMPFITAHMTKKTSWLTW